MIRFNDYDGGGTSDPAYGFAANAGAGATVPVGGYAGIGVGANVFAGNMFRNAATLAAQGSGGSFTNLPLGGRLSFSFLFAAIDSWDDGNAQFGPDNFELLINGSTVYSTTVGNFPPSSTNGGTLLSSGSFVGNSGFIDSAWDFTNVAGLQSLPYAGTSVTYLFRASGAGWQGGDDESWAVDNFRISLDVPSAVPEPETYALMLLGLGAVAIITRRKLA